MKTIEIKLYNFEELSKEAQDIAIEGQRDFKNEFGDGEYSQELIKAEKRGDYCYEFRIV